MQYQKTLETTHATNWQENRQEGTMKEKKSILPASTKSPINASSVNNNEQQTIQLLFQEFIKTRETRLISTSITIIFNPLIKERKQRKN